MDSQKEKTVNEAIELYDNSGMGIGYIFPQIYDRAQKELLLELVGVDTDVDMLTKVNNKLETFRQIKNEQIKRTNKKFTKK